MVLMEPIGRVGDENGETVKIRTGVNGGRGVGEPVNMSMNGEIIDGDENGWSW